MERIGRRPLCHDAQTHANLLVRLCLALLEVREIAYIVGELVVGVELVRVGVWLLGLAEGVDLVGPDLEILLTWVSH